MERQSNPQDQTKTDARPDQDPEFYARSRNNATTIAQESVSVYTSQARRPYPGVRLELLRGCTYPMEHNPCGLALIIGNENFSGGRLEQREGCQEDVAKMDNRFREKGFQSDVQMNLTKAETLQLLKQIAGDEEGNKFRDCFVLVLLSHGNEEGIDATDHTIKIQELLAPFYSSNCPSMIGKPKIFILQCCRGNSFCQGLEVQQDLNEEDARADYREYTQTSTDPRYFIPDHADFLVIYAACQGFKAFRNTSSGSPFITFLSEELDSMQEGEDFYQMLTKLNRRFYQYRPYRQQYRQYCQMPCFESTLTKTLKFP